MGRSYILFCLLGVMAGLAFSAIAQERGDSTAPARGKAAAPAATHTSAMAKAAPDAAEERALRLEGEKDSEPIVDAAIRLRISFHHA
jgi:hypothetical protein